MHLDAEQVAEPVREKGAGNTGFDEVAGVPDSQIGVDEYVGEQPVCLYMEVPVIDARLDPFDDVVLQRVHTVDQVLEALVPMRIGAGDVGRVAVHLCAGIDQERQPRGRDGAVQRGVVQHGRVLVQRHDTAVRQFCLRVVHGGAISVMDVELGAPIAKRRLGGQVPGDSALRRQPHDRQFIVGLCAAREMQYVDSDRRIDALDAESLRRVVRLPDDDALFPIGRQVRGYVAGVADDAHVEMRRPETVRSARHHVPVVARLVVDEYRRLTGRVNDAGGRQCRQRRPADEMRVRFERKIIVVEESGLRATGVNDGVAGTSTFQCPVIAGADGVEVLWIQRRKRRIAIAEIPRHGADHTLLPTPAASAIIVALAACWGAG